MRAVSAAFVAFASVHLIAIGYTVDAAHVHNRAALVHHIHKRNSDPGPVKHAHVPKDLQYKPSHVITVIVESAADTNSAAQTPAPAIPEVKKIRLDATEEYKRPRQYSPRDDRPFEPVPSLDEVENVYTNVWTPDSAEDPETEDLNDLIVENTDDEYEPKLEIRSHQEERHNILLPRQDDSYMSFRLGDSPQPSSTISAAVAGTSDLCPDRNGTTFKSRAGISYQVVCNIDFPGHDYPFVKAGSLEQCILRCDALNWDMHGVFCLAGIFVPSRVNYDNDCYLKSSVNNPTYTSLEIHGLVRLSAVKAVTSSSAKAHDTSTTSATVKTGSKPIQVSTKSPTSLSTQPTSPPQPAPHQPGVTYAKGDKVIIPKVLDAHLHGPSKNTPSSQYLDVKNSNPVKLASNLLTKSANGDLTSDYPIDPQTGVLSLNISTQSLLSPLDGTPRMSRDGGSGGFLNGHHLFIFCDTGSYASAAESQDGKFVGFVSSSVAVDVGMNGIGNKALHLQDGIGQWYGGSGRQRGFVPLTEGELAYNLKMQGGGQRYAIWPEAPILPLDATRGIIYAPVVFDDVNRDTGKTKFTYTGATLLTITADNKAGPSAERTVPRIFEADEVEWGCSGGIRSWGSSGIGSDDGKVYIFGNVNGGILLARTTPENVADRDSFEFWHGKSWSKTMLQDDSDAFFIEGVFMDINVFYSPRHLTFIIVYLTTYADNTFYYRYLKANTAILPHYAPGGDPDTDYVENILKYEWSEQEVLYRAPKSLSGRYIYAGAIHAGYYGANDVVNGGSRMLLSWTSPTGKDPASEDSEYQIVTAGIDWV